jgi:hypothetical protein
MKHSTAGRRIAPILAVGLASVALDAPRRAAPHEQEPSSAAREVLIPVYQSASQLLVMLNVNGRLPAPVIFDTGTNGNLLDLSALSPLGLAKGRSSETGAGETHRSLPTWIVALDGARLGDARILSRDAEALALRKAALKDAVGIFGPNSFSGKLVYMDLERSRIVVMNKGPTPENGGYPYYGAPGHRLPGIEVQVAGHSILFVVDTGSDRATMEIPLRLAKTIPLMGPLKEFGRAQTIYGEQPVYRGRIRGAVRIGRLVLDRPTVTFTNGLPTIGLGLIRRMKLLIDPAGERTWILGWAKVPNPAIFAGRYGERTIRVRHGELVFQRDGQPALSMRGLGADLFEIDADTLVRFRRIGDRVVGFDQIHDDGEVLSSDRTG